MVFYKGKQLDQAYLQKILTPDKVEKLLKLVYLHKEDALQLLQKSDVEPEQERSVSQVLEPCHEKTSVLVSDLVRHKPGCTATEDG